MSVSSDVTAADSPEQIAQEMFERVLEEFEYDTASVSVSTGEDGEVLVDIEGDNLERLIGRRAATLDALQQIAFMAVNRAAAEGKRRRVILDVDGYRARRESALKEQADRAAGEALSTGKEIELEPMTAHDRRLVHTHLAEQSGIATHSVGDEPNRRLVVSPT